MTLLVDQVGRIDVSDDDRIKRFEIGPGIKTNSWKELTFGFNEFVPLNREGLVTDWIPNGSVEMTARF